MNNNCYISHNSGFNTTGFIQWIEYRSFMDNISVEELLTQMQQTREFLDYMDNMVMEGKLFGEYYRTSTSTEIAARELGVRSPSISNRGGTNHCNRNGKPPLQVGRPSLE